MSQFLCPDVIQGCGIRLTDLDQWGITADPLTEMSRVFTSGFIDLTITPVVFQNAPIPVGGDTEGEACIIDNDTPKLTKFDLSLRLCGVPAPVFEKMLGATLLEDPDTSSLFRGFVLKDGHAECCADTLMLEIFSKSSDGCETGNCPFTQWIIPLTRNWQLSNSFTYANGETEFTLTGTGEANPSFFPSMPGPTLPSYTAAGVPEGASPPILPVNPATNASYTADVLVQSDVDEIRAHGPLAMFCIPELPDGINDCGYMNNTEFIVPPIAVADAAPCFENATCTIDINANDIAGTFPIDFLSYSISNVSAGLTVTDNMDGTVDVSAATVGVYSFDYSVDDTQGNTSNTVTVTITVSVLVPPVAVDDAEPAMLVCGIGLAACDDYGVTNVDTVPFVAPPIAFDDSFNAPSSLIRVLPQTDPFAVPDAGVTGVQ